MRTIAAVIGILRPAGVKLAANCRISKLPRLETAGGVDAGTLSAD
jgi:hypothetical protein